MVAVAPPHRTVVTVVQSSGCHFCADAAAALDELGRAFALTVELVDAAEPRGAALVHDHRAGMFPLVLVDGGLFSSGRLPRRKLRKLLADRAAAVA